MDSAYKPRLSWRITLLSLTLIFVGAGFFAIYHKDTLLPAAGEKLLATYGLTDLQAQQLQFNGSDIYLGAADFTYNNPALGNQALQIQLRGIQAKIHWRNIFTKPIEAISVKSLNVQLQALSDLHKEQQGSPHQDAAKPTKISTILPYKLIEQLPVEQVLIQHWQANLLNQSVIGTTTIDNKQQAINTKASLDIADTRITLEISSNPDAPLTLNSKWTVGSNTLATLTAKLFEKQQEANTKLASSDFFWQTAAYADIGEVLTQVENKESALRQQLNDIEPIATLLNSTLTILTTDKLALKGRSTLEGQLTQPDAFVLPPALAQFITTAKPATTQIEDNKNFEGLITIENNFTVQKSENQFNLNIAGVSQIALTNDNWKVETSANTEHDLPSPNWLDIKTDGNWLENSESAKTLEEFTGYKIQFYGATKVHIQNESFFLSGGQLTPKNITLNNTQINLGSSKTLPLNASLQSNIIRIETPTENPDIQSEFIVRIGNSTKDIAHNWKTTLQLKNSQLNVTTTSDELAATVTVNGVTTQNQQNVKYTAQSSNLATTLTQVKKILPATTTITTTLKKTLNSLELTQGTLTLNGQLNLQQKDSTKKCIANNLHWQAENIHGLYNKIAIQGLKLSGKLTGIPGYTPFRTEEPVELTIASVHAGANVKNLQWSGYLIAPEKDLNSLNIQTESFNAEIFSGKLELVDPFNYNLAQGKAQGSLRATAWQLNELIALQKNTIEAQGLLDGDMNFLLTERGLEIPKGRLLARPPGGIIRYPLSETQAIIASSPELALTMRMLDNFNYRALSTDITLSNSGELHLGLNLNGMNPKELDGRSVEFNINVDQNILPLLESLRLNDQVINRLEQKIKQRY